MGEAGPVRNQEAIAWEHVAHRRPERAERGSRWRFSGRHSGLFLSNFNWQGWKYNSYMSEVCDDEYIPMW